ncbi:MAG: LysR family transcriptional regulator [Roseibium sp.]|uniref:LysR substrate-binding domain-containing protein n=1 Tax=Roseibium sp. TaxID=1936156 RepID=UPI00263814E8|nr:LysR substrate-binding domain-containing protein [Roseibium sp.]MCV0429602.1 LysR family transcriptional regulator [Roseibium sp.]
MQKLHKNVPSPKALIAFEAAARHLSFTAAADELNVTQVAVTYQVQKLEQDLGTPLFVRSHRRLSLTSAGDRLNSAVRYGLGHIAETVTFIRKQNDGKTLTVAANNAVSFYWLRDRAIAFQIENPGVELRLLAGERDDIEFLGSGVDIAIRHGSGDWDGLVSNHLFDEEVVPVCSPDFLKRNGPFPDPASLRAARLLRLESLAPHWITWETWFAARSVEVDSKALEMVTFNSYPVLLEVAIAGQGVALGGINVIDRVLEEGKLIRIDDQPFHTGYGYYLVRRRDTAANDLLERFTQTLLASL